MATGSKQARGGSHFWTIVAVCCLSLAGCQSADAPDDAATRDWKAQAREHWDAGRVRRTLEVLDEAGLPDSDDMEGAVFQATVLQDVGRFEKSLDALDAVDIRHRPPREAYELRLNALRTLRRHSQAHAFLQLLLWTDPDDVRWRYERGEVLAAMGESDAALADFRRVQELTPSWWRPYVAEAAVLLGVDRPEAPREALAALDRCPVANDSQPTLDFHRALCSEALGDAATAQRQYASLLTRFPDHQASRINLALLYEQDGNLARAHALYQEALDRMPEEQRIRRESLQQRIRKLEEDLAAPTPPSGAAEGS